LSQKALEHKEGRPTLYIHLYSQNQQQEKEEKKKKKPSDL